MNKDFPEGAALIFGGSGGIGRGVAEEFAKAGTSVAICYRSKPDVAEAAAQAVREHGVEASIHQVDVRDAQAVQAAVDEAVARHGRVHSVIWGAGPVVAQVPIMSWTDQLFRDSMEIEAFGLYHAAKAVIPHMREMGGGSFVHLGSAGHDWWPKRDGLSVVPKAANEAFMKGIAKEEGRYNIRANSVLIGVIDAGQFQLGIETGHFNEAWQRETKKLLSLQFWGTPEDVGQACVYFASSRARYVTAQTISVSGGFGA
jgi:3-oxoacyl-[acyl-carrier protein] reductase